MRRISAVLAVLVGTLTMGLVTGPPTVAGATTPTTTIYDSTSPSASTLPSLGYGATQATEIGNQVHFAPGTSRTLNSVTVTMDSWGCGTSGSWIGANCVTSPGATFAQPITFNLYQANPDNSVGSLITTVTQTVNLKYRPSADNTNCTGGNAGKWFDGTTCYNGIATDATINLGDITVPDKVVYGVEIRTSNYGDPTIGGPLGSSNPCNAASTGCPYDALNLGLSDDPTNVTVGSNVVTNAIYWNTGYAPNYCDSGASAVGTFRLDAGCWGESSPYTSAPFYVPAVQFNAESTCTTTCYVSATGSDTNAGASDSPFATIAHALATVSSGGTVHVGAGTFNEKVVIHNPVTLDGANAGTSAAGPAARAPESVIAAPYSSGNDLSVEVASPNVTVDGFSIQQSAAVSCSSCAAFGVQVDPTASNSTVGNNIIQGMTTSGSNPGTQAGNPIGINVAANNTSHPNNVTVDGNLIQAIHSLGTQHKSAQGILVGDSTVTAASSGLVISNNHITDVNSAGWGGYGIILNRPTTGSSFTGNTLDAIYGGGWAHGIGLEANESSPSVQNNSVSVSSASTDAADLFFEHLFTVGGAAVTNNSFTGAPSYGVANRSVGSENASTNWWGCPGGANTSGCSSAGGDGGALTVVPWIAAFTPDPTKTGQPGFWPTAVTLWSNTTAITSAPSVQIAVGKKVRFTVTTHGNPAATITAPDLPGGMTFKPKAGSHAGTAQLGGAPVGSGDFTFHLHATNGPGPDTIQAFTVHVLAISSSATSSFSKSGPPTQSFTITTTGAGSGVTLSANLTAHQAGLTFHDNGDGTATLSGTPTAALGSHLVKITATSGAAVTTQKLAVGINA